MIAVIYSVFGMTPTAGYVRGLVAIVSYSTLFAMLPWFGRRLGLGTRSGVLAGVAGALIPRQGMDEIIGWGVTANVAMALGLVTVAFLQRWTKGREFRWRVAAARHGVWRGVSRVAAVAPRRPGQPGLSRS